MKKGRQDVEELKLNIGDLQRQVDELTDKNQDIEHDFKHERSQFRIAKAHIESLVKVTTAILEHIVTKCQINITNEGRARSQNMSQISDYYGATSVLSSSTDQFDRSYEDERRNLVESIKSILTAKL